MKLLKLHMFPWASFHFLANPISCLHHHHHHHQQQRQQRHEHDQQPIKLIKSDGHVKIYDRPIPAAELMTEFPKHLVCRSDSFYIGQKIPALAEDDHLQLGHKYFLLPKHCFQTVLSFVTIASLSSSTTTAAFLRKAGSCQPFDIQKSPSGCARIRVSDEFIAQLIGEGIINEGGDNKNNSKSMVAAKTGSRVCTTAQLEKDYTQLVNLRRWKPKLDAIKETAEKRSKVASSSSYYHYSFGMKRVMRRKSSSKNQKSTASCSSSCSSSSSSSLRSCKFVKIKSKKLYDNDHVQEL